MLIIPPLVLPDAQTREVPISPYGRAGSERTASVRCPLLDGQLLAEGACYDFQALAQGAGSLEWQESTARLYEQAFKGTRRLMVRRCVLHQLEIVESGEYPDEYERKLRVRLSEIDGQA